MIRFAIPASLALIAALTVAWLWSAPASAREPAQSGRGGKIAFVSDRDGNQEIYVMNADGSGQTRLTTTRTAGLVPPDMVSGRAAHRLHL